MMNDEFINYNLHFVVKKELTESGLLQQEGEFEKAVLRENKKSLFQ
jgi:hypothetical protein